MERIGLWRSFREWWKWHWRNARVHIDGIAEYRATATVVGHDDRGWHIEDDEGRVHCALDQGEELRAGDRIVFEPRFQGSLRSNWSPACVVVRKVGSA